jgi:magnesium chelatase family protein
MNPCVCGHLGDPRRACRCSPGEIASYRGRISGPLLDRIDIHVEVPPLSFDDLGAGDGHGNGKSGREGGGDGRDRGGAPRAGIDTASLRAGVLAARERQSARNDGGAPNARLTTREIDYHCGLSRRCIRLLREAHARLGLSARGTHRVLPVARTIADLEGRDAIAEPDIAEAIQYRALDRDPGR